MGSCAILSHFNGTSSGNTPCEIIVLMNVSLKIIHQLPDFDFGLEVKFSPISNANINTLIACLTREKC